MAAGTQGREVSDGGDDGDGDRGRERSENISIGITAQEAPGAGWQRGGKIGAG